MKEEKLRELRTVENDEELAAVDGGWTAAGAGIAIPSDSVISRDWPGDKCRIYNPLGAPY